MDRKPKINIYGDSIMKGTVIDEEYNYHFLMDKIVSELEGTYSLEIKNRSHYGFTISKGERLLERDIQNGIGCDIALIEFGGNDCNFNWGDVSLSPDAEHKPRTDMDAFRRTYLQIIEKLKKVSVTPILMNLPPLDAEKYLGFLVKKGGDRNNILKWLGDAHMIYRFHELYSNAVSQIAEQTKTLFIDVRGRFLDKHNFGGLIGLDGIHPDIAGYKLIIGTIKEYIENNLGSIFPPNPAAV
ncbi:MAG: SGNH/GDSL hydrolase family protein [Oscillospiraceae bacterium]|nr:SGNH/GDSL hydrolase family protein [Oscillospiraceae bacterium]